MDKNEAKVQRILEMYTKMQEGKIIVKEEEAKKFGVSTKSIQRDIREIRTFMEKKSEVYGASATVRYDRSNNIYKMEAEHNRGFSNSEIYAISKILLDSRAFTKKEMTDILYKLNDLTSLGEDKIILDKAIGNEIYHYTELQHKTSFMDNMWTITQAIQSQNCIKIGYKKEHDDKLSIRTLQPMGIAFSEFYFYLVAYIIKDNVEVKNIDEMYPIIYRLDRIKELEVLADNFRIPNMDRYEEGLMKKRIQFMQGGKLQQLAFEFIGESIEAVKDRLPTARVLELGEGRYEVRAETYGRGVEMWIRSQGDRIAWYKFRDIA